jgi:hypothetical protein
MKIPQYGQRPKKDGVDGAVGEEDAGERKTLTCE